MNLTLQWRDLAQRLILGMQLRGLYDAIDFDDSQLDDYAIVALNASWAMTSSLSVRTQ
ncbi:MAG: hypothetical protein AB8B57_01590 [Congregibacter sp.]